MHFYMPSQTFTRPSDTTAYTANDLVANSTTAGSVTALAFNAELSGGRGLIVGGRLSKSGTTVTLAKFDLHLFHRSPTVTNGDNGAFAIDTGRYYIGKIAFDLTSGAEIGTAYATGIVQLTAPGLVFDSQSQGLAASTYQAPQVVYGLLVATAGYTPTSAEVFEAAIMVQGRHL